MVGHQDESQQAHRAGIQGFAEDRHEGRVVGRLCKQGQARHGPIEGMIHQAARGLSRATGQGAIGLRRWAAVKKTSCVLFPFSF